MLTQLYQLNVENEVIDFIYFFSNQQECLLFREGRYQHASAMHPKKAKVVNGGP